MATVIKAGNVASGAQVTPDATGILQFNTGSGAGTAAMTIDASQNVTFAQAANLPNTFGFKNRIINGAMVIDQRNAGAAVTLTNASFTYGVDRWAGAVSSATSTVTTQRVSIGSNGFQYGTRILRGSGTYTGNAALIQEPESLNTFDLQGQTVTISYWARKGSAATGIFYVQLVSGTGTDQGIAGANNGSWTGWSSAGTSVAALTTTLAQYTATFTLPSNATEIAVLFNVQGYSGTGSANDYVDITGVQLEKGSTATSFDYRPYSTELQLAQRYYWKMFPNDVSRIFGSGQCINTTTAGLQIPFQVQMRTRPTSLEQSGTASHYKILNSAGSDIACSAVPTYNAATTDYMAWVAVTVASGITGGNGTTCLTNNAAAYLAWSAEL